MEDKERVQKKKGRGHKARGRAEDVEPTAEPRQQWCIIVSGCLLKGR